jgi:hypothetical protein
MRCVSALRGAMGGMAGWLAAAEMVVAGWHAEGVRGFKRLLGNPRDHLGHQAPPSSPHPSGSYSYPPSSPPSPPPLTQSAQHPQA